VIAERDSERMYASASMIKTFLLAAVLDDGGPLDEEVEVTERAEGDGVLKLLDLPVCRPRKELLALMIAISDNTATRAVLTDFGGAAKLNAWLEERGFESRWHGRPPWGLGQTSAAEHERIVREMPALGIEMLLQQQDRRALARTLDEAVPFAHKTGTIEQVRHDGGVVCGDTPLYVHAFTDGGPTKEWVDHPACVGMGIAMEETLQWLTSR
jgi:beta-lactamase class A